MPVLRHWNVFDRTISARRANVPARSSHLPRGLDAQATRFVDRREENRARIAAREDGVPQDIAAS